MKTLTQTTFHSRILEYRKTHTLQETGEKFKLSAERIRQIELVTHRKRCEIHKRFFFNKCSHCLLENSYEKFLSKLSYNFLLSEVQKEANNRKRDYLSVRRRVFLINVLHNKYKKTFSEISKLLDKNYSTVVHLYNFHILQTHLD